MERLSRLARRTAHLLLLEAFALTFLVFPLQATQDALRRLREVVMQPWLVSLLQRLRINPEAFWAYDVEAAFNSGHEPLVLKEGLFKFALILAVVAWLLSTLTRSMPPQPRRTARHRLIWFLAAVGLLGVSLILGTLGSQGERRMVWLQSRAFFTALAGLAFFALLQDFLRSRRSAERWIGLLFAITTPVLLISLTQHLGGVLLPSGTIAVFGLIPLPQAAGYERNAIGSLIGHNNGAALVAVPGLCLARAVWSRTRRVWLRAFLAAWAMLALWVVIRSQSRSVIISLTGGAALWFALSRWALPRTERPPRSGRATFWIAAAVAALVALQTFDNPLRGSQSLGERMSRLVSLSDLMRDTRMRTLVTGMPAFFDRPLMGWGIGSFAWIYPWYQGQHFQDPRHESTRLHPTTLLTPQAHNDWLQLSIELGLLGLVLVLAGLWLHWGRGWRFARDGCPAAAAPFVRGVLCAGLILAIQAGLDFPMHVIPTALLSLLVAALTANAPEIWGTPRFSRPQPLTPAARTLRWSAVAALLLFSLWPARWWAGPRHSMNPAHMAPSLSRVMRPVLGEMLAESRHVAAQARMDLYFRDRSLRGTDTALWLLTDARRQLRDAIQITPASGALHSRMGEVLTYLGEWNPALYHAALDEFAIAIEDVRNYTTYYYMGECHQGIALAHRASAEAAAAEGDTARAARERAEERRHWVAAMRNYNAALVYNPGDPYSADTLAKMLIGEGEWDQAARIVRLLRRWSPNWYRERWYNRALNDIALAEWDRALPTLRLLRQVEPDDRVVLASAAVCLMRQGSLEEARRTIREVHLQFPEDRDLDFLDVELLVEGGDLEGAVARAREMPHRTPHLNLLCLEHIALTKLGRLDEAREVYSRIRSIVLARGQPEAAALSILGDLAWDLFEDRALAAQFYESMGTHPLLPPILSKYRLALLAAERGDRDRARELLASLGNLLATHEPSMALWRSLEGETSHEL